MAPVILEDCLPITSVDRQRLLAALTVASLTKTLSNLSAGGARLSVVDDGDPASEPKFILQQPVSGWGPTPGGYQSDLAASYRFGSDASHGVSALLDIRLPNAGMQGGRISFVLDLGLSLSTATMLGEVAKIWSDSLVALTNVVPKALGDIVPPYVEISHVELHAFAPESDGQQRRRENSLATQIAMQSLGHPSRPLTAAVGLAMRVDGALTDRDAAEIVANSVERIALAHGFLDPVAGIRSLRAELGLSAGGPAR